MKRQDIEKLLGGYAAGTLTEAERTALFAAALEDQALFDALADEEALRDALADSGCRARVATALAGEDRPARPTRWWILAGGFAAACIACVVIVASLRTPQAELQIAKVIAPPAPAITPDDRSLQEPLSRVRGSVPSRARRQTAAAGASSSPSVGPRATGHSLAVAAQNQAVEAARAAKGGGGGGSTRPQPARPQKPVEEVVGGVVGSVPGGRPQAPVPAPPPWEAAAEPPAAVDAIAKENAPAAAQQVTLIARDEARQLFFDHPVAMHSALMARDAQSGNAAAKAKSAAPSFARLDQTQERPRALGLRYSLVRRGLNGADMELPIDTPLRPGEPVRLRVESNEQGYLYVLGPQGALFTGAVEARHPVLVDAQPGALWVVLSREPASETVANLVSETQAQLSGAALRSDKPLEQRPRDPAVYVANPSSAPAARVIAGIRLNFSEPR